MINLFSNIEYGEGTRPYCKFNLLKPIQDGKFGNIYRIDAALSEDLRRIDVWLISKENGKIYYPAVRNRFDGNMKEGMENIVSEIISLTKDYTKQQRQQNYVSTDTLNEIVSKVVRKTLLETVNKKNNRQ